MWESLGPLDHYKAILLRRLGRDLCFVAAAAVRAPHIGGIKISIGTVPGSLEIAHTNYPFIRWSYSQTADHVPTSKILQTRTRKTVVSQF